MPAFVVDTNILISYALSVHSTPGQAVQKAFRQGRVVYSAATLQELIVKLAFPKFDRYVSTKNRAAFIQRFALQAQQSEPTLEVRACRDPKDDMFLSLAVASQATYLISGDKDLLDMKVFQSIPIVTAKAFLDL
ncbi:putative toxin-antitoxin system toxin component, PIN family [Thiothrix subterranea]|uniref:putative toxin-antitoxin system toxin component, PIN family n=1 Tax=Thiothrix subterranea TaxID=2735563 RepID=UPI00192CE3E7|nr:putative toxin-antitoxin system toxin component, PIN family [Thiothrix subterranea]QQZ30504.1 putative toxin-antitoxin system toxin component, PIN family [Thiothrix subterranea]